jgi:hypothetical protein
MASQRPRALASNRQFPFVFCGLRLGATGICKLQQVDDVKLLAANAATELLTLATPPGYSLGRGTLPGLAKVLAGWAYMATQPA